MVKTVCLSARSCCADRDKGVLQQWWRAERSAGRIAQQDLHKICKDCVSFLERMTAPASGGASSRGTTLKLEKTVLKTPKGWMTPKGCKKHAFKITLEEAPVQDTLPYEYVDCFPEFDP